MEKEILLKPCPFCGKHVVIGGYLPYDGYQNESNIWRIKCDSCQVEMLNYNLDTLKELWNRRAN